jgi:hypothetical protein
MQQTEIISLAEKLIPAYHSEDFEQVLAQITEGEPSSVKFLVKIELKRLMSPCEKNVDLRGHVHEECTNYILDGLSHWLDDVAFNEYHKCIRKFGGYTEGVWEALYNTPNNARVMSEQRSTKQESNVDTTSPFEVEVMNLGYDLKRKENRLKLESQAQIQLSNGLVAAALTVDLSPSGAKLKVPAVFNYQLGDFIEVQFTGLVGNSGISGLEHPLEYRILAIDDSFENDAVRFLRLKLLKETGIIQQVIDEFLHHDLTKTRHKNQDNIVRTQTRAYEHTFLKHACQLPLFFDGETLKVALLTESNHELWRYWHDERNQQSLGNLFNPERMALLTKSGLKQSNHTVYVFKHSHQEKTLFFSMIKSECIPELRKLFWHIGAKRESWRTFRISMFELSQEERQSLATESPDLTKYLSSLTHCAILQEVSNSETAHDYLFVEKPKLPGSKLNPFMHQRKVSGSPVSIFFDARSQRKEPRYKLHSPLEIHTEKKEVVQGKTIDLSKRGLSLRLITPLNLQVGHQVTVDYLELKLYDKKLPLHRVPYRVVRITPNGQDVQLIMEEDSHTVKIITFFRKLFDNNLDKLTESREVIPSLKLLENLHHVLLDKIVCSPFFVERQKPYLKATTIGVHYPLDPYLVILAKLGHEGRISLEPLLKGHTNTLLAKPMKHIENAKPKYHDIYLSIKKFGTKIHSVETRLISDFDGLKERITFIKDAQLMGEIFVLRVCGIPVFNPITALLRQDLDELSSISKFHATKIEKAISSIVGYGEIIDITEEVLIRLEISH